MTEASPRNFIGGETDSDLATSGWEGRGEREVRNQETSGSDIEAVVYD